MKKRVKTYIGLFIFGIILFFVTFFISIEFFHSTNEQMIKMEQEKVALLENSEENKIVETSYNDEKISNNCRLVINEIYEDCKHDSVKEIIVEKEMVNLTKEEFCKKYPEYKIKSFSKDRIEVEKKSNGFCDEHFKIVLGDEFIEVLSEKNIEEEELYLVTGVSKDYLTKEDKEKLKNGIEVYGRENINSKLEDYE